MSKHFIDSDMWDDLRFMEAEPNHKLIAVYMISKCDCAGIFRFNPKVLPIVLGFKVTEETILEAPVDVLKIGQFLFWLKNYCKHQYGTLDSRCRAHRPVFSLLAKHGLLSMVEISPDFDFSTIKQLPAGFSIDSLSIPYRYPIDRHKEQEQEQEQEPNTRKDDKSNTGTRARKDAKADERRAHIAELMGELTSRFPEFPETWERWEESRRKNHHPLTDTSREGQLQKLLGISRPIQALQDSINGDWQGLFDPDERQAHRAPAGRKAGFKNQADHMDDLGDWVRNGGFL